MAKATFVVTFTVDENDYPDINVKSVGEGYLEHMADTIFTDNMAADLFVDMSFSEHDDAPIDPRDEIMRTWDGEREQPQI